MKKKFTQEEIELIKVAIQVYKAKIMHDAHCVDTLVKHINGVNALQDSIELKLK